MIRSIYPVLMTEKLNESTLFYKTYFSFTETFSSGRYISLSHPNGGEPALIDAIHKSMPAHYRSPAKGMILNIEVEDATRMYKTIQEQNSGIIVTALRDEAWGQRHFMVEDPNGIPVAVIEIIPPSGEFQNNYSQGVLN
ncbi:MAG: hypothetical protein FWE92_01675 [Defluviitaleaceae bacterium]|nr:hypothetical protein [Defluviitaleaceae bacterium]